MRRNVDEKTKVRALELRKSMTPEEKRLWSRLRAGRFMNLHIRKQHPIGPYITDFYIPQYKLVIELDGEPHDFRYEKDCIRDQYFQAKGYRVLRIKNDDIKNIIEGVVEFIKLTCIETAQPLSVSPPDLRGETV